MRIVMMGAGGVGGLFGARLAQAGADVVFVARGAHLEALRRDGLVIENSEGGETRLARVEAVASPAEAKRADLVVVSVKLGDTAAAIEAMRPLVKPGTAVLSLQNGVVKDDLLRQHFPADDVMGGVAYVAAHITRPGVIRQTGQLQRVIVGEYDRPTSARAQRLAALFRAGGIDAEVSADIRRTLWEKYTFLVGLSGTTATMRSTIGPIREHPRARVFLFDLMKETVAVGRALGVNLPEDYAQQRLTFADTVPHAMSSSLRHDLERGAPLEVEWLSGGVVTLGERAGVPTPANAAVWAVLSLHAAGRAAPPSHH